jgi:hypothetical protein
VCVEGLALTHHLHALRRGWTALAAKQAVHRQSQEYLASFDCAGGG